MTPDGQRLNAGWYSEPEGSSGERWWNGSQWTSHTRDTGGVEVPAELAGESPIAWSASDSGLATIDPPARETAYLTEYAPVEVAEFAPVVPAPPVPLAIPPGWYPDPAGLPAQRWWDGLDWTKYQAPMAGYQPRPAPGYPYPVPSYGPYGAEPAFMMEPPKSVGVAFVLTFFFGPLGMLYSTVSGALIMLGASLFGAFFIGIMTLGLGLFIWWPAIWVTSIVWGCVAAGNPPPRPVLVNVYR